MCSCFLLFVLIIFRFYSPPYSIAPNRMIAQTSLSPYMPSQVPSYQVSIIKIMISIVCVCSVYTQWYSTVFSPNINAQYYWKYFFKTCIRSEQNSFQSCDWSITAAQACQFYICFKPRMLRSSLKRIWLICSISACLYIVCLINKVLTIYWSSNIQYHFLDAFSNIKHVLYSCYL